MRLFVFLCCLLATCNAVTKEFLYPRGTQMLPSDQDEVSSPEITLQVPIVFYGVTYNTIYVNANGLLSFLTEIPSFFNIQFPLDYPVIAPLYTNVDTRASGAVYYRETQEEPLLTRATNEIRAAFSNASSFTAGSLFIATWWSVGYAINGSDKQNTYQAVVVSDGMDSYLMLLYADGGVQWIQGTGQATRLPDARAQAGLVSNDGRMFTLRGSGTDQIQNIDKWSNIGNPGLWLFHIGAFDASENVDEPDIAIEGRVNVSPVTDTCSERSTECHSKANCVDYEQGFCCSCQQGYFGNGINCVKEGIPLRVNGKVHGIVNGVVIQRNDLQSYVVTSDGRTYTAVSGVEESIGFQMQTLNVLGGIISWLFAKPISNTTNGYHLTGGELNQTVDITFLETNDKITIVQQYSGLDVFDQLRMEAEVRGTLPRIPRDSKISVADYEEAYTRSEPGIIHSRSSQSYRVGDSIQDHPFVVEQTIQFEECLFAHQDISTTRLKVERNYISYEAREKIVRYAMTGKTVPIGGDDPCKEGQKKCGPHSACHVEGDQFKCVCNRGYQYVYDTVEGSDTAVCVDINECTTGTSACDPNALCLNEPGTFSCQCIQGYTGDGRTCVKLPTCRDLNCHPDADCIESHPGLLQCECRRDFEGDGLHCTPKKQLSNTDLLQFSCDVLANCSPYGKCTRRGNRYACVCLEGFEGDGHTCHRQQPPPPPDRIAAQCDFASCWCPENYELVDRHCDRSVGQDTSFSRPLPACYEPGNCICPPGFEYLDSSSECRPTPGAKRTDTMGPSGSKLSCNILNTCHPYAQCIYTGGQHQCRCNAGYEGEGIECHEIDVSCHDVDICHEHATCTIQENSEKAICMCNPGFQGDGTLCSPIDDCNRDSDCHDNAARCLWVAHRMRHECTCEDGYQREGTSCIKQLPEDCQTSNNCAREAQCLFIPSANEHVCQCNPGYSGDGFTCSPLAVGCNVLSNCAPDAECYYSRQASGYRCQCKHGFRGNGMTCVPEQTCQQNPFMCGAEASCVVNQRGVHVCQCNEGFTGNGVQCKAASRFEGNFLLLNQGMATLRVPFTPTSNQPGRPIAIQYQHMAIGIDVDCLTGRVYWSDITGSAIKSSDYNGSDVQTFIGEDIKSPEGVSVDWVSRNIYWTDSSKDTVEMANIDSKERKIIASDQLVNPRGIAVFPSKGKVFWSDWNRAGPKLEWANLDGSGRSILLQGPSVQLPNSLAVDSQREELCWADAGSKKIECVGINRPIERTVASNCSYPFGLTMSADNYYWTDWDTRKIESAQRPSGKRNNAINVPMGGNGKLYGIVAVPENCPR